ncbi:MAG: type 4 pilus major pilin [Paracoccaceae bacterium]|nr:type 4 pilus major pilin [Paracoccaceae bacterium]
MTHDPSNPAGPPDDGLPRRPGPEPGPVSESLPGHRPPRTPGASPPPSDPVPGPVRKRPGIRVRVRTRFRRRRGVSLVDFLLYLTLAAVVLAGAVLAYNNVDNRQKRLQTTQLVNEVYAAVTDLHRNGASYGTSSLIDTLEAAKMIPSKGRRSATDDKGGTTISIVTPFGEGVTVAGDGNTFTITIGEMSEANCIDLVSNYADQDSDESSLSTIAVGSSDLTMPASLSDITAACDDDEDVELTFR